MGAFLVSTMSPCTIPMSGAAVELKPCGRAGPQAVVDSQGCDYKASLVEWHLELRFHVGAHHAVCRCSGAFPKGT